MNKVARTGCVLIADDNPVNLLLAATVLRRAGHEVMQATDALAVMQILRGRVPDLILMDIALGDVDGLILTRQLKNDVRLAAVPIVAFSANTGVDDERNARDAGCSGYLTKPINTHNFANQVAQFMPPT